MITMYEFQPYRLGVFAPKAGTAGQSYPTSPLDVLAQAGAEAALNGPMFSLCSGGGGSPQDYAASQCDVLDFLHFDASRDVTAQGRHPSEGMTIYVDGGVPHAARGAYAPNTSSAAVQGFPPIIWDGEDVTTPTLNLGAVWRSALCIMGNGNLAFAVGTPESLTTFAGGLLARGVVYALYTDGGGSTSLVTPGGIVGDPELRRVASWLVVNQTSSLGLLASLGIGAAAAYWYYRRYRKA